MKKLIIIFFIVLLIITLTILGFIAFRSKKPANNSSEPIIYTIKPLPSPKIPIGNSTNLITNQGEIKVNNFYKNAKKIIEATVYLKETQNYSIMYFSRTNQFLISLNAYNEDEADSYRSQAEQDLLSILGITQEDACKLILQTQVPYSYNGELSKLDYNLSFCPNGIPFKNIKDNSNISNKIR